MSCIYLLKRLAMEAIPAFNGCMKDMSLTIGKLKKKLRTVLPVKSLRNFKQPKFILKRMILKMVAVYDQVHWYQAGIGKFGAMGFFYDSQQARETQTFLFVAQS